VQGIVQASPGDSVAVNNHAISQVINAEGFIDGDIYDGDMLMINIVIMIVQIIMPVMVMVLQMIFVVILML
jgi:hypothetical protein